MTADIKNIFDAITPDNIKNIPAVKDAMAIFIETLQELSKESIDIKNVYTNELIREELVKIYLEDLYRVFQTIKFNQKIIDKIDMINAAYGTEYYKKDVLLNISKYITDEHFLSNKSFKEKKGTAAAIEYIYNLVGSKITSEAGANIFSLTENDIFNFTVQGSLPRELYEAIVSPLANPLGFIYVYDQILSIVLEDFFTQENFIYIVNDLEVRCLNPDGSTFVTDYKYYRDAQGNIIYVLGVPQERVVQEIRILQNSTSRIKNIIFNDNTYLKQVNTNTGQTNVFFMQYVDGTNDTVINAYTAQCSVYFNYTFELVTTIIEELNVTLKPYESDTVISKDDPNSGTFALESLTEVHNIGLTVNQPRIELVNYNNWFTINQPDVNIGANSSGTYWYINDAFFPWFTIGEGTIDIESPVQANTIGTLNLRVGIGPNYIGEHPVSMGMPGHYIGDPNYKYKYYNINDDNTLRVHYEVVEYSDAEAVNLQALSDDQLMTNYTYELNDDATSNDDTFSFSVYRNDVLLVDNNMSSYPGGYIP